MTTKFSTVDEYVASLQPEVVVALDSARATIHAALPSAVETLSYQIIGFTVDGRRVMHLAGWRTHLSLYPVPAVTGQLAADLERYRSGKSTLRFPLTEPLPLDLIRQVVALLADRGRAGA
jgi:uncharacterized protein YdhG (YjbR/CyaY superfamily)